jgi:DNA ligase-1
MRSAKRSWVAKVVLIVTACVALVASLPALSADEPPRLLLAETVRSDTDVTRYLVSEKLDGVRAFWDGRVLVTRGGHVINAPAWFVEHFPARALDGELWAGRGQFERTSATVRRQTPDDAEWRQLRYMIFELPQAEGDFRERVRAMQAIVAEAAVPWLRAVEQFTVRDRKELDAKLARVVKAGGEGLMLHRADAPYLTGRHDALLKMKPLYDAEATVVGHLPGKGKYLGMLGALRVRTEAGIEFSLGSGLSDAVRRAPPPVGTIITYRYREVTERGIPRFASYHRVRE